MKKPKDKDESIWLIGGDNWWSNKPYLVKSNTNEVKMRFRTAENTLHWYCFERTSQTMQDGRAIFQYAGTEAELPNHLAQLLELLDVK